MDQPAPAEAQRPTGLPKSKPLAVWLSLLLGPFVWAYTYERDKTKFWVGNAIQIFLVLAFIVALFVLLWSLAASGKEFLEHFLPLLLIFIGSLLLIRIWTLVERLKKPAGWYAGYPRLPLSKTVAIVLAIVFSYLAWLYTYEADKQKFWLTLALTLGLGVSFNTFGMLVGEEKSIMADLLGGVVSLMNMGFWIWVIIDVASKSDSWYRDYPTSR